MTMTLKRYLTHTQLSGTAVVTEVIPGERPVLRLRETWFHPQGGGQKADRGFIGPAQVVHVAHNGAHVDHFVDSIDGLEVGREYAYSIDAYWRRLNSVYHTAGHLIASVAESVYPDLKAVSGHQWPGEARVEFESISPLGSEIQTEELQARLEGALSERLSVKIEGDPFASRHIVIGAYPGIPCGGTHVDDLKDIEKIMIAGVKRKGNRIRVSYEATSAHR
jgi:alanyl-tRNA synthetase